MRRELVFLDENRDPVPPREAVWAVETFVDDRGMVVRETWSKVRAVSRAPRAPAAPAPSPAPAPAAPPAAPAPAPPPPSPVRWRATVLTGAALLVAAVAAALTGQPELLTGALAGAGVAAVVLGAIGKP